MATKDGKKTGGRQKGTPNKLSKELTALLEEKFPGYHPVVAMATLANDPDTPPDMRFAANREVAQYVAPKRKAIEHSGNTGVLVHVKDLTGE